MRTWLSLAVLALTGCAQSGTRVPLTQDRNIASETANFCTIAVAAPERLQLALEADDVQGVDCVPPQGGEVFSLGFSHAGWWLQLDVARSSLVVGVPHAFDGQAALLALDCWEWDGSVTVDADARDQWALHLDARCRDDADKAIVASFNGER
jgi:hypothetical protein